MPLGGGKIVLFRQADEDLPAFSIDPTGASNKYLSMSGANYGTSITRTKLAISLWVKPDAAVPAGTVTLYRIAQGGASTADLQIQYLTSGVVRLSANFTSSGAITHDGTTDISDGAWHHIYGKIDTTAGSSADRMELYIDGATEGSHSAISLNDTTSAGGTNDALAAGDGSNDCKCLVYQAASFDNNLPAIGDLYSAGNPKSVVDLAGLYSYLDCDGGTVTSDGVLASAWTNNNSVANSADIP